jgi:elongation factor 1-alpha
MTSMDEALDDTFSIKMSTKHIRIAVIGNVDSGKSTLIGTLKSGILDNGRGQSRLLITKHQHEIDTGRTSTITSHLIGYKENDGKPVTSLPKQISTSTNARMQLRSDAEVATEAGSLVSLIDLAGHEKYLKTTIHGISSGMLDYALVLVNANQGPNHMTRHHISLATAFGIPIIVVLTKIDSCPKHVLKNTKEEIANIIRSPGVQKRSYQIKKPTDITVVMDKMHAVVPIISISSVSGDGLDLIHNLLRGLPKRRRHENKVGRSFEFLIHGVHNIIGAGTVVSGFVNAGKARVGETVWVGPLNDGSYLKTVIKSAQISRTNVSSVTSGNFVGLSFALSKDQRKMLRKGMVALVQPIPATRIFEAEMVMIKGSGVDGTTVKVGYETMAHILHLKQHVMVENIELLDDASMGNCSLDAGGEVVVRPGNRAKITFRFLKRKEFIRPGMRMLFRDGHVRGVGIITRTRNEIENDNNIVNLMQRL